MIGLPIILFLQNTKQYYMKKKKCALALNIDVPDKADIKLASLNCCIVG